MKHLVKTLTCVCVFAIAMGFLESAVVIYLREIYYKEGFSFPLKPMPFSIALVEVLREAATVIMLIGIGFLAGKTRLQRFAYFSLAFAVWDLFYYVFLYVFLGWPQSLFTWDILFLIPLPWVGPVWAPCLLSLLMLGGSVFVIIECEKNKDYRVAALHWLLLIGGAVICIVSFMWDYFIYQQNNWAMAGEPLSNAIPGYVPVWFNSPLFFTGLVLMSLPVFYNMFRSRLSK